MSFFKYLHRRVGSVFDYLNRDRESCLKDVKLHGENGSVKCSNEQELISQSKMTKFRDRKEWRNPAGQLHRTDGPAIEFNYGTKYWYFNDKIHRTDGPAIENEYAYGANIWCLNGKIHRENGPAVEYIDGSTIWYYNGEIHRLDGPAVECADGAKYWYFNGKIHRTDGPAIEEPDGTKSWYLNGERLTKQEFMEKIKESKREYYDHTNILYDRFCFSSAPLLHEIRPYPSAPPLEQ